MAAPSGIGLSTPEKPPPSSSPLSSPESVVISPSSFLDQVRAIEVVTSTLRGDHVGLPELEEPSEVKSPKALPPQSRTDTLGYEDELAGDSATQTPSKQDLQDGGSSPAQNGVGDASATSDTIPNIRRSRRAITQSKKIVLKQPVKKTPRKSVWTAERLLTDPKSPLAKADLRSILTNPVAWDVLDANTQAEILALFPSQHMVLDAGTENARPDIAAMMNDDTFRGDCASYTENIKQGRHEHDWLVSAYNAHQKRKMGDYDEFLLQKFYEDWEVDLPDAFRSRRAVDTQEPAGMELQEQVQEDGLNGVAGHVSKKSTTADQDVTVGDASPGEHGG